MTARSPRATAVVLETFRTYYAAFRAVNLSFHALTQAAAALNPAAFVLDQHSLGVDRRRRGSKRATCRSSWPCHHFQRAKHRSVRIHERSCTGGSAIPANLSENSVPDFQPCGQGSYYEALRLRCRLLLQDSKPIPHPQATVMPLADLFVIADEDASHNPRSATLVKDFSRD